MPLYTYECDTCDRDEDAVRTVDDRDIGPMCLCGREMYRVFRIQRNVMSGGEVGYQPAFGKHFANKRELREELRRLKYERGVDLVEVGNEREYMKKIKPEKKEPEKKEAYQALRRAIKDG